MITQYIVLALIFCLEIFIISKIPGLNGKSKVCTLLIFLQFWIFYGFRDPSVLPDTGVYYKEYIRAYSFLSVGDDDPRSRYGVGYQGLEYLFKNDLGLSFMWFLSFCVFIYLSGTLSFIYRYSTCTWLAIFFFVMSLDMFNNLIAVRQSVALSIGLASFPILQKRRYLLYSALILFASTFHSSAIGYLLLIPLMNDGLSFKSKMWIILGGGMLAFTAYSIVFEQLTAMDFYGGFYVKTSEAKGGVTIIGLFNCIRTSIYIMLILYLRKLRGVRISHDTMYDQTFFLISLLSFAISTFSIRFWIMGRFRLYFDPFLFVYATSLYTRIRHKTYARYAMRLTFFGVILTSLYLCYVRPEWVGLFPFKFYDR